VRAYATAHEIYDGDRYWLPIQALDAAVPAALQLRLFSRAIGLMKHATTWLLNNQWSKKPIAEAVSTFRKPITDITKLMPDILPPTYRHDWDKAVAGMEKDGTPHELAVHLANTMVIGSAPDIVELAQAAKVPLKEAAGAYFMVGDKLRMLWLLSSVIGLQVQTKWQALARSNLREDAYLLHRRIAARALEHPGASPEARIEHWIAANEVRAKFSIQRLQELHAAGVHDFMTLAVGVRELRKLRQLA
jgi:glutamate dehydrogenase